jgi:hypothetical protein
VPGYASGFLDRDGVIHGPGTGTSDSIFAWMTGRGLIKVSNKEAIMNARAVRKYGPALKAMNDNRLPAFAGGAVPQWPSLPSPERLRAPGSGRAIVFDMRGAVVTEDLLRQMQQLANDASVEVVRGAAPAIVSAAADHTINRLKRPSL